MTMIVPMTKLLALITNALTHANCQTRVVSKPFAPPAAIDLFVDVLKVGVVTHTLNVLIVSFHKMILNK